jgi:hypothetical protein
LMVHAEDEIFAITSAGGVIRTAAAEVKQSGRQTMGVRLVNLAAGQSLVAIARNEESLDGAGNGAASDDGGSPASDDGVRLVDDGAPLGADDGAEAGADDGAEAGADDGAQAAVDEAWAPSDDGGDVDS